MRTPTRLDQRRFSRFASRLDRTKTIGHGYKIVIMRKGETLQDFITGFLKKGNVNGRPCDIMKLDANSFLFTDDYSGDRLSTFARKGTTTAIAEIAAELPTRNAPSRLQPTAIVGSQHQECVLLSSYLTLRLRRSSSAARRFSCRFL